MRKDDLDLILLLIVYVAGATVGIAVVGYWIVSNLLYQFS